MEPYSQAEAEAAAGLGQYRKPERVAVPSMQELHALRSADKVVGMDGEAAGAGAAGDAAAAAADSGAGEAKME